MRSSRLLDHVASPRVSTLSSMGPIVGQISGQTSRPGRPITRRGSLLTPSMGRYASLKETKSSSGPHHRQMGKRERRQMLTAEQRLRGHVDMGPTGVRDQSTSFISCPAMPPAAVTACSPTAGPAVGDSIESASLCTWNALVMAP